MKDFGSEAKPLHCSSLKMLTICPWRIVSVFLTEVRDEGGQAGDTGSAVHHAVAELHRGKNVADALESMGDNTAKYPLADLQDAATMFLRYSQDPRNQAKTRLIEAQIAFDLAPTPEDPTGTPIRIVGRVDQVRDIDGVLKAWDIKTSKKDPIEVLYESTLQIAGYCVGASMLLAQSVHPGGIIAPRRYKNNVSTDPVFYHAAWTLADAEHLLEGVRHIVASIRRGAYWHTPGKNCDWCHQKSPDLCFPKLKQHKLDSELITLAH